MLAVPVSLFLVLLAVVWTVFVTLSIASAIQFRFVMSHCADIPAALDCMSAAPCNGCFWDHHLSACVWNTSASAGVPPCHSEANQSTSMLVTVYVVAVLVVLFMLAAAVREIRRRRYEEHFL